MLNNHSGKVIGCIAALLLLLACGILPGAGGQPQSQGSGSSQAAGQPAVSSEACTNPLYPAVKGATWSYAVTGAPTGPLSYTDTVTDVRADGFTLTSQFDKLTRTQEWACKPEGLLALELGGGPAGAISTSQVDVQLTTSNVQGVTLPAHVSAGDKWAYSLDFQGTTQVGGVTAQETGKASIDLSAIGTESVTVPAGTFDATKIEVSSTLNFQIVMQGVTTPVVFTGISTVWYAPGVGMVKSVDKGELGGTAYTTTTELQSYSIPQ
jgi:hypothetical protein